MHYVFLIHGSGDFRPGWSAPHKQMLNDAALEHSGKSELEIRDTTQYIEVNYQHLLNERLDSLITGGETLGRFNEWLIRIADSRRRRAESVDLDTEFTIGKKLAALNNGFLLDALVYTRNPETVNHILLSVAEQILSVIAESPRRSRFSFLGHGLGTKVIFDFLHRLYTPDDAPTLPRTAHDSPTPFSVSSSGLPSRHSMRVNGLYLASNVAPLLGLLDHTNYDMNHSHVRVFNDKIFPVQEGIVRGTYRVFNNKIDPIAQLGRSHLVKSSVYSDNVQLSYANQFWMHDLKCYMEHPQVCLSMVEDVHNCRIDAKSDIAAAFNTANQPKQIAEGIAISFAEKIKDDADAGRFAERDVFISFMKSLSEQFDGGRQTVDDGQRA